jgi:hypothetical protein
MKIRPVYILLIVAPLALGTVYRALKTKPQPAPPEVIPQPQPDEPQQESAPPKPDIRAIVKSLPEPVAKPLPEIEPEVIPPPVVKAQPRVVSRPNPSQQYWAHMAQRFDQQQDILNREANAARRMNLIRSMAGYVRVDTLSAIDWAMALENPAEQRAALEAINNSALVGIGARIEMDETGLPKIKNTTILSAVESTGMVEHGDHIAGVIGEDGQPIYFKGLSIRDIVGILRGKSGTEVQLLIPGDVEPYTVVPVTRSIIVIEPPL